MNDPGKYVKNIPCPSCQDGHSNQHGLAVYYDEVRGYNGTCFKCGKYFDNVDSESGGSIGGDFSLNNNRAMDSKTFEANRMDEFTTFTRLEHRGGISQETCERYGVRASFDLGTGEIDKLYFPRYREGELVAYKVKDVNNKRNVSIIGNGKRTQMFGENVCGTRGKLLIITEGEEDCLAAYEMLHSQGKNYRVCSLPDGANVKAIQANFEWLNTFETIVLAFDQDEPGIKCAKETAELFQPGKVKIMHFSEKDANDMFRAKKEKEFLNKLHNATEHRPDGIVSGIDTWERVRNRPPTNSVPYPEHWKDMNTKTYGTRLGELDIWTSGSGMGKTQIVRELQFHLLNTTTDNMGIIALEEPLEDSVEALMGLYLNKRIHLPDVRESLSDEDYREAWEQTQGSERFYFYDHFGSVDEDSLLSKIRYLVRGCGCKRIFLDHLSIVISEFADQGNERERIDTVMSKLKNLTQELNIWIGLIVHLRKTGGGKSFEEGAVPTLDDLRGSGSLKQLSNNVYALSRNQQADDPVDRNTSQLHVLKCRFTGRTGSSDYLYFNENTGRMIAVDPRIKVAADDEEF